MPARVSVPSCLANSGDGRRDALDISRDKVKETLFKLKDGRDMVMCIQGFGCYTSTSVPYT